MRRIAAFVLVAVPALAGLSGASPVPAAVEASAGVVAASAGSQPGGAGEVPATGGLCPGLHWLASTPQRCTHGPDPVPPGHDGKSVPPLPEHEIAAAPDIVCSGDGVTGNRVHVLYVHPPGLDRYAQYLGSFRTWASRVDAIYDDSARETGGSRHIRFVTDANCAVVVTKVTLPASAITNFDAANRELRARGFNRVDRKYLIFSERHSNDYCGQGTFVPDSRPGQDNPNNVGPDYGYTYSGCWGELTPAHELGHNLGAVNYDAPNSSGGAHCTDEQDRMCYSDYPHYPPMQTWCSSAAYNRLLDCRHDDYFSTDPAPGSYLSGHWNAASNQFLIRGAQAPGTAAWVDAFGGCCVNLRSGPGTGYPLAGSVADEARVVIVCTARGTTHTGRYGSTNLWDRLSDGTWISDAFVYTATAQPAEPQC